MNKMNYGCEGLCVVISGGTSGIGLAAAQRFLTDGARVYILGRSKERGEQALRYLEEQTGKQAVYISCDVTKQAECKAAVAKIAEQEGRPDWQLDILVNSAGFYREQRLEQLTEADFDAMMMRVRFRCAPSHSRASPYEKRHGQISLCASTTAICPCLFSHCSLPTWTLYHTPSLLNKAVSAFLAPGGGRLSRWPCGPLGCG